MASTLKNSDLDWDIYKLKTVPGDLDKLNNIVENVTRGFVLKNP